MVFSSINSSTWSEGMSAIAINVPRSYRFTSLQWTVFGALNTKSIAVKTTKRPKFPDRLIMILMIMKRATKLRCVNKFFTIVICFDTTSLSSIYTKKFPSKIHLKLASLCPRGNRDGKKNVSTNSPGARTKEQVFAMKGSSHDMTWAIEWETDKTLFSQYYCEYFSLHVQ